MVEDQNAVGLVMARTLTDAGYDVRIAADGVAASVILRALHVLPNLVITDLHMPGMDGEELITQLRRDYPSVPILIAAGFATSTTEAGLGAPLLTVPAGGTAGAGAGLLADTAGHPPN